MAPLVRFPYFLPHSPADECGGGQKKSGGTQGKGVGNWYKRKCIDGSCGAGSKTKMRTMEGSRGPKTITFWSALAECGDDNAMDEAGGDRAAAGPLRPGGAHRRPRHPHRAAELAGGRRQQGRKLTNWVSLVPSF